MIESDLLLTYLPSRHGEHGVDATLHGLAKQCRELHEVFSNPPGGSWTAFDIQRPVTKAHYRWDHMPRVPGAKRPDFVLQYIEEEKMDFITIESKQDINDVYPNMGSLLVDFFIGSKKYLGLKNRPAWQKKEKYKKNWELLTPECEMNERYWFKNIPSGKIKYWPGFVFARNPEYTQSLTEQEQLFVSKKLKDFLKFKDLHIAIMIGWQGPNHFPFAIAGFSEEFEQSQLSNVFKRYLEPVLLNY